MSIAWRLAQAGCRVTVFDKGEIGSEASWAAAGMLALGGEIEGESELGPLMTESRRLYPAFVNELQTASGLAIDYQECGALDLAYSPAEWDTLHARAARQSALGIRSKAVSTKDVSTFWPQVQTERLVGALFYPGDAIVHPREVITALAAASRSCGASVVQNCSVHDVEIRDNSVALGTESGAQSFDVAVIAAGAWSSSIRVTGVPPLAIAGPVKGHLIGYQQPDQTCRTIVRHAHRYLLQRANGLLICGTSLEQVGFNRQIDPGIVASLVEEAEFLLPHLQGTIPTEVWIGFRPGSDELHIGSWHSSHLYLAYGHYRNGVLLAPLTAQRIVAEITASLGTH